MWWLSEINNMGGKTVTNKTELPPETPEDRQLAALFNAALDAQMSQNYNKVESRQFVYNKQAEIDQAQMELNQLLGGSNDTSAQGSTVTKYGGRTVPSQVNSVGQTPRTSSGGGSNPNQARINELQNIINDLKSKGGQEQISYQFNEKPEVAARRLNNQAEQDKINQLFFQNAQKVLNGDFSITDEQRKQIKQLVSDNFDPAMDILKTEFSNSETAVNDAVTRLVEAGKTDIVQQLAQNRIQQKQNAELLGRSYNDLSFQREADKASADAFERLYSQGAASAAQAIGSLRTARAQAVGSVAEQKGNAGYNLSLQAANPLSAFTAGAQFAQLNGQLNAQNLANQNIVTQNILSRLGQLGNLRAAQPITTQKQPFGVLDALGAAAGLAGTGIMGASLLGGGGGLSSLFSNPLSGGI